MGMKAGTVGVIAVALGLAAVGAAVWLLGGSSTAGVARRDSGDAPRAAGPAPADAPAAAAIVAARADDGRVAGGVSLLGRLVRGTPRVPVTGEITVTPPGRPARTEKSGADGRFLIDGLPPGVRVEFTATAEGLLPFRHGGVLLDRVGGLDMGDVVLGIGCAVEVLAVDRGDRPVAGATVTLRRSVQWSASTDWIGWMLGERGKPIAEATASTKADGTAVMDPVPPGSWTVVVQAKGYGTETSAAAFEDGRTVGRVRVVLQPAHALKGTVRHHDGRPAAGIPVIANAVTGNWFADDLERNAVTDAAGAYALEGLRSGENSVAVRPGPDTHCVVGTLQIPEVSVFDIRLQEGITVKGKILDDRSGAPLAGARVSVNLWGGNTGDSASYGRGVSGEDGAYEVKGLQPGHFGGIQARMDGYLDYPDSRKGAMTSEQLAAGAAVERDARLRKGAAVAGRVADAKGTPVAGARVVATSFAPQRGMDTSPPALTAEDGSFRIENLPPGMTLLRVRAEGCAQADYPNNEWEALQQGPAPESCSVKIPEEGEARKDLVVVRGGSVSGAVADRDGKPVPGLQVTVSASKNSVGGGTGTTDAEGKFRLEGVAPGDGLKVSAFGPKSVHGTSDEFSLAEAASADGIRVTVTSGASLAGRLARADGGTLADANLRLVQGAIDPDQPWNWDWQKRSAGSHPVAADGSFRIDGLMAGKYTLLGDAPGAADATSAAVEVAAGEAKEGVDLVLGEEKSISGKVVSEAGEPVAGARISAAQATTRNLYWGGGGQGTVAAVTGADGAFTVGGTGEGSYRVIATAPGLSIESVTVKGGTKDVLLTLKTGGTIAGLVVDESTGEPVADLTINAHPMVQTPESTQMQTTARTGKDGRFTLRDLKPGDWTVTAGATWGSADEYVPKATPNVKVGTADLRIAVARGVAISGSLVDGDGKTVSGQFGINAVGVSAEGKPDGSRQRYAQTDGDGTFRLPGLKPGAYDLQVNSWGGTGGEGWAPASRKGVMAGTDGVTIVMRRGAAITGKILDEEGKPWSKEGYLTVTLSGEGSQMQTSWGQVQEDGTFATQPLESGKNYDLSVQGTTQGLLVGARGVAAGSKDVVVRATKGGSLSGTVVDEEGKPVAKCPVRARGEGLSQQTAGAMAWGQTGDDGRFTISGLVDARYKVTGGGGNSDWMGTTLAESFTAGSEGLVIQVKKGLVLSGRLVDASGNPVKPQALSLLREGGSDEDSLWGQVADDGAFTFKGLSAAKYRVRAYMGDGWKECGTFEAPASGVTATLP